MNEEELSRHIYAAAAGSTVTVENLVGEFNDEQREMVCRWIAVACCQVLCNERSLNEDDAVDMIWRVQGFDVDLKRVLEMAERVLTRGEEIK